MIFVIDLDCDGYDSQEEMEAACVAWLEDNLDSAGTCYKLLENDTKALRAAGDINQLVWLRDKIASERDKAERRVLELEAEIKEMK